MGAVHHDVARKPDFLQRRLAPRHGCGVVVRAAAAAAQHDVGVGVAAGVDHRHLSFAVDAEEAMRAGHRPHGVDGDVEGTVRAVLEAHDGGQARRHFAVDLGFGGARADGRPGDEVLQVLGRDGVQRFGGQRQPRFGEVEEQLPRQADAVFDVEGVVQAGIVDEALPAHRRARLLEIRPHHHIEGLGGVVGKAPQARGVVPRRVGIVDGARPDHHQQPVIAAFENVRHAAPRPGDELQHVLGGRQRALDLGRRRQHVLRAHVEILGCNGHVLLLRFMCEPRWLAAVRDQAKGDRCALERVRR